MISIISMMETSMGGLFKQKPPWGPFVELSIFCLASNCKIFPRKGVGISNFDEISLIPIFFSAEE